MSNLSQVTIVYGENKLQKTIKLPASTTVTDAKKTGSDVILKHLRDQPGVPPSISIDDECTDFYPDARDTARMRDLKGPVTMVVWPKAPPGSGDFTPSPVMDALSGTLSELDTLRAQRNADALIEEEKRQNQRRQSKPGPSSILPSNPSCTPGSSSISSSKAANQHNPNLDDILSRLASIEASNGGSNESNAALRALREDNTVLNNKLEEMHAKLEETNASWKLRLDETNAKLDETNATLQTTMEAVFGDRVAINKIRNRVLLDMGRNKLAVICGHKSWKAWKTVSDSRDAMIDFALTRLNALSPIDEISARWIVFSKQRTALQMLLLPNQIRDRGDLAAHASAKESIAESILALTVEQGRADMNAIFKVVFGEEPVH